MKILFLNNVFPEVSQTFVLSQIRSAVQAGHQAEIVATRPGSEAGPAGWDPTSLPPIHYAWPFRASLLRSVVLRAARRPAGFWPIFRGLASGKLRRSDVFAAALVQEPPDVILANFGENGIRGAALKRFFFPQARLCVIFHGQDMSAFVAKHGWGPYREIASEIDLPLGVNETWVELLKREAGMNHARLHHIGVQLDGIGSWTGRAAADFSVLFVGRLVEKKGLADLLRAAALLRGEGRSVSVDVIGDGPERAASEALAIELGLQGAVQFYRSQPHEAALRQMALHDCLVVPSATARNGDAEGIPVALMEGMATGMPVVATRHSGIPEVVTHEITGLLVPERHPQALAESIAWLMDHPDEAGSMGARARELMWRDFDASRQNRRLLAALEALCAPER